MKILVTGCHGQVGHALTQHLQGLGEIHALGREQLDLSRAESIRAVMQSLQPAMVINAAAYTAVDQAESEEALALRINAEAPGILAEEAKKIGASLIHYSTDYVFDGSMDRRRSCVPLICLRSQQARGRAGHCSDRCAAPDFAYQLGLWPAR